MHVKVFTIVLRVKAAYFIMIYLRPMRHIKSYLQNLFTRLLVISSLNTFLTLKGCLNPRIEMEYSAACQSLDVVVAFIFFF